jgi:hypothetical protein
MTTAALVAPQPITIRHPGFERFLAKQQGRGDTPEA